MENFKHWTKEKDADRLIVEASAANEEAIRFYREKGVEDYIITLEEDF